MNDLNKALADIGAIRAQLARELAFCGYGPATLAATGALALAVAAGQAVWLADPTNQPLAYFGSWFAAAALAIGLIGIEVVTRSRRLHSRLADEMVHGALEQFVPSVAGSFLLALVLFRYEPQSLWMLPGLWQILVSLGIFSAARSLPRVMALVGAWYMVAGLAGLVIASASGHDLSPWAMGVPFGVGQLLFAAVLYRTLRETNAED